MDHGKNQEVKIKYAMAGVILCFGLMILISTYGDAHGSQKYPEKAVDLIVPFGAGAATDMLSRFMAIELSKKWGQPVNVINKPGGNAVIGTHFVMSAPPDGYTLLIDATAASSAQIALKNLPYEVMKRTFIALAIVVPQVIIRSANAPWQNLQELAEEGRKNPSRIIWGASAGGRSDIALLQFFDAAKIQMPKTRKVDFPGGAAAVNALAGGHVDLKAGSPGAVYPVVSSGKAKALAVTTPKRCPLLPEVPTTQEAGFPGVNYNFWIGFSGPPNVPKQVTDVIRKTVQEILEDPLVQEALQKKYNSVPGYREGEAFKKFVIEEGNESIRLMKLLTGT